MTLIYPDSEPKPAFPISIYKMDPHKQFLKHYGNYMYLLFMERNGTFQERRQANKELAICRRKMAFWEKHPTFNIAHVEQEKHKIHLQWQFEPTTEPKT